MYGKMTIHSIIMRGVTNLVQGICSLKSLRFKTYLLGAINSFGQSIRALPRLINGPRPVGLVPLDLHASSPDTMSYKINEGKKEKKKEVHIQELCGPWQFVPSSNF